MSQALDGQERASKNGQLGTRPRAANVALIRRSPPDLARASDDRGSEQGVRTEVVEILADAIFSLILQGQALAVRHQGP